MKIHGLFGDMTYSEEVIAPQGKEFYKALVTGVEEAKLIAKKSKLDSIANPITRVIKKYTGLSIPLIIEKENDIKKGCMIVNTYSKPLNKNHVFYSTMERFYNKEIYEQFEQSYIKGTVSIDRNRVTGEFTELMQGLSIANAYFVTDYFTSEEIAGIILHEVGHAFTYLELLDRTVSSNLVMLSLLAKLNKTDSIGEKTIIVEKTWEKLNIRDRVKDLPSKDNKTIIKVTIERFSRENVSLTSTEYYDLTNCEQCADQYSARCGGAVGMASWLEKANILLGNDVFRRSNVSFHLTEIASMLNYVADTIFNIGKTFSKAFLFTSVMIGNVPAMLASMTSMIFCVLFSSLTGNKLAHDLNSRGRDYRYDNDRERIRRMKEDLINQLKYINRDTIFYIDILDDIRILEIIYRKFEQKDGWISKWYHRLRMNQEYEAKELEGLAANDLFVIGNEFKYKT